MALSLASMGCRAGPWQRDMLAGINWPKGDIMFFKGLGVQTEP